VVTGDPTQIDLPGHKKSGLAEAARILSDVPGIGIVELGEEDVVRHPLVQRIVRAYREHHEGEEERANGRG
jgi:phosphate starvation-inducible PhoH-like protein